MNRKVTKMLIQACLLTAAIFALIGCGGGGESNGAAEQKENSETQFPPKSTNENQALWGSLKWGNDCWKVNCSE